MCASGMYDESCKTGECFIVFTCQSNKCGCSSSEKTYTYGEYTLCVDKDGKYMVVQHNYWLSRLTNVI